MTQKIVTPITIVISVIYIMYVVVIYEKLKALRPNVDSKKGGTTGIFLKAFALIGVCILLGMILNFIANV